MWARVRSFDEEGSEANPGKLIYLPVTLIRQSKVTLLAPLFFFFVFSAAT